MIVCEATKSDPASLTLSLCLRLDFLEADHQMRIHVQVFY